jgi:hypothetical protein
MSASRSTWFRRTPTRRYARGWNAGAYGPNAYGNAYFFENIQGYDDLQVPEGQPAGTEPKATEMSGVEVVDPLTLRAVPDGRLLAAQPAHPGAALRRLRRHPGERRRNHLPDLQ